MQYIIGVDGGGTNTVAIAYSLDGKELGKAVAGFGNVLLGEIEALSNITNVINICMEKVNKVLKQAKCIMIFLGLAGVESAEKDYIIRNFLEEKFRTQVKVVNDAIIAHAALLEGKDGILTISGTGSISYGIRNGNIKRVGGWGHLLGDEGSGYHIAIEALKLLAWEEDFDMPPSEFSKAIMDSIKINKRENIKDFVYSSSKGEIAALVPVIVDLGTSGEETAVKILKSNGEALALTTLRVYESLNFNTKALIGIKGSILTKVNIVKTEFQKVLTKHIEGFNLIEKDVSATWGAYVLAINHLKRGE